MRFTKLISVIFHPVFMPLIILYTYLNNIPRWGLMFAPPEEMYIFLFFFTILIPIMSLLYLVKKQVVSSVEMKNQKERSKPLFITSLSMLVGAFVVFLFYKNWWLVIQPTYLSCVIIVILSAIISKYWKISLHMLGVGGLFGALLFLYLKHTLSVYFLAFVLFFAFLIGFVRLKEKAHDKTQLYIGFLIGLGIQLTGMILL